MNQVDLNVILIGLAIVFVGLLCIILLCKLMSLICSAFPSEKKNVSHAPEGAPPVSIPNRGEFIAAVSAAIAEETGEDASSIRILSVKKL